LDPFFPGKISGGSPFGGGGKNDRFSKMGDFTKWAILQNGRFYKMGDFTKRAILQNGRFYKIVFFSQI
jgi:hypothetical protein